MIKKSFLFVMVVAVSFILTVCATEISDITFVCPNGSVKVGETVKLNYTTVPVITDNIAADVYVKADDDTIGDISDDDLYFTGLSPGYTLVKISALNGGGHDACGYTVVE